MRLSYSEQRELATLPELIEALEAELEVLQAKAAEPGFYRQNPQDVSATLRELADLESRIAQAYERWQILER